ncbi:MAG: anaerobic ribonucleoside triphosphate reductase [Thermoguttaceae bacterium]|jgi:anaerobic ribonucleoside-triphosphate reductase
MSVICREDSVLIPSNNSREVPTPVIESILKRDGREVPFNEQKIADAMRKAFDANRQHQPDSYLTELAGRVTERLLAKGLTEPCVEEIQDCVEEVLKEGGHVITALQYSRYRKERSKVREQNSWLMKTYTDITFKEADDSDIKRENANIDGNTAMGMMLKYGSEGAKHFFKVNVMRPEFAEAHDNGDIHIHDMDFYTTTTTCCQIDLTRLFAGGFSTGHGILREPQDIQSYAALACIAIQSNQNDQHGGQSIPNFDYALSAGVNKTYRRLYRQNLAKALELYSGSNVDTDELKKIQNEIIEAGYNFTPEKEAEYLEQEARLLIVDEGLDTELVAKAQRFSVKEALRETDRATFQAMEALVHNLNTMHSRAGAQTPFSSINYGTDTSPEGRMVTKNVLLAQEAGLGDGETPIFPIHIFRVKDGVNAKKGDPNYDLFQLACRVSAKRLFPNFSFQDAPFNLPYYKPGHPETEVSYMGCRTRVIGNVYDPQREIAFSRGNLSFTSINLPRIAIKAHGNLDWFFEELGRKIDLCVAQLLERFGFQSRKKAKNFPFLMGQGCWLDSEKLSPEDEVGEILKHGTFSIGFIGLAETLKALIGFHHGESETAQNLGLEIVTFMRQKVDAYARKMNLNFTLLATPAEGLAGRFVRIDRKRFGEIEGVTDREYYTNSFHIPVYYDVAAYEKIRLEAPYHALTNAGHITYVEVDGDISCNPEAFEDIVNMMRKGGIGYGAINHPVDRDPVCGYTGIINDKCPKCGREEGDRPFERIRRITGYLVGTLDRFNNAKRKEVGDRVKHAH